LHHASWLGLEYCIYVISKVAFKNLLGIVPEQSVIASIHLVHVKDVKHVLVLGNVLKPQLRLIKQGIAKEYGVVLAEIPIVLSWTTTPFLDIYATVQRAI
jgi:hypothetical protein